MPCKCLENTQIAVNWLQISAFPVKCKGKCSREEPRAHKPLCCRCQLDYRLAYYIVSFLTILIYLTRTITIFLKPNKEMN